jgi:hypothetical protein
LSRNAKAAIDNDARPTSEFDKDIPRIILSPGVTSKVLFLSGMLSDMNSPSSEQEPEFLRHNQGRRALPVSKYYQWEYARE